MTEARPEPSANGENATSTTGVAKSESSQSAKSESIKIANNSDQPTEKDSLGFEPYVKAIAAFLVDEETEPPLTLSIEGEWGSGKSSFMKQLQEEIKRREQDRSDQASIWQKSLRAIDNLPHSLRIGFNRIFLKREEKKDNSKSSARIIEFNAWRHDKAEALWAAFALEFLRQISKPLPTEGLLEGLLMGGYKKIKLFCSRLNWQENWREIIRILFQFIFFSVVFLVLLSGGLARIQATSDLVLCMWKEEEQKDESSNQASSTPTGNTQSGSQTCQPKEIWENVIYFVLVLGSGAVSTSGFHGLFSRVWQSASNPKNDLTKLLTIPKYDEQIAFIEKFHEDFDKIVAAYAGTYRDKSEETDQDKDKSTEDKPKKDNPKKVYVFIDDLDRCELSKSADLMQAINLMITENPHLIFILGMDREKVAASIALKQEALLPYLLSSSTVLDVENAAQSENHKSIKGLEYGYAFMEKFIQLPFQVPRPSELYFKRFIDNLSAKAKTGAKESDSPSDQLKASEETATTEGQIPKTSDSTDKRIEKTRQYLRIDRDKDKDSDNVKQITLMVGEFLDWNPRRVKQFINLFRLKVLIAAATGLFIPDGEKQPLTLEQIGKYTAICVKYPRLQIDLGKKPDLLGKLEESKDLSEESSGSIENGSSTQSETDNSSKVPDSVTYWASQQDLVELLQKGKSDPAFSLKEVKIQQLMGVATHPVDRVELKSEVDVDYTRLRDLLRDEQWREADKETYQVMLRAARKEKGYLDAENIKSFPCQDLQTIDQLWVIASRGQFGFSVQKKIYVECGAKLDGEYPGNTIWEDFCDRVGWRIQGEFVSYSNLKEFLNFSFGRVSHCQVDGGGKVWGGGGEYLFSRIETCEVYH